MCVIAFSKVFSENYIMRLPDEIQFHSLREIILRRVSLQLILLLNLISRWQFEAAKHLQFLQNS